MPGADSEQEATVAYSYSAAEFFRRDIDDRGAPWRSDGERTTLAALSDAIELRLIVEESIARLRALGTFGRTLGIPGRRRRR